MDETFETNAAGAESAPPKVTWRQFLESDEATRYVYLGFAFTAIAMVIGFLQTRTTAICCGDWDGYYHIRWSQLLWQNFSEGKWLPTFTWLPLTVLNPDRYADQHFLFHLLQIPFLWFFEPVTAAKAAAIVFSTLAVFSVYWLVHRYRIDYPLLWLAAILTCANMFYYRMSMAKAPPLTIIFSIIGIYLLFERKYVWLLPLMFAFVWTYSLFPLLWFAAIIWTLILLWNEHRLEWRPVAYTTAGMVAGNIINPYFPNNLYLFFEHFITKFKVGTDFAVSVGGEWYPYTGMELLTNLPVAMLAMLIGYILFMPRDGKLPEKATFFLVFVTILFAAQFRSKRFSEYFPPFAILFAAFSWQAFKTRHRHELPDHVKLELEPFLDLDKQTISRDRHRFVRTAAASVITVVLALYFLFNMVGFRYFGFNETGLVGTIAENEPNDRYQRAMEWAQSTNADGTENIPAGSRIFNSNWDDFPKLFYLNTKVSYVYGLDPNYLYSQNPELYKLSQDITSGKTDNIGPIIREKFGANFIFSDAKENEDMIAKALESGWVEMAYEDEEARILKIRDVKGEPAKDPDDDTPPTPEEQKQLDEEESGANVNAEDQDDNAP